MSPRRSGAVVSLSALALCMGAGVVGGAPGSGAVERDAPTWEPPEAVADVAADGLDEDAARRVEMARDGSAGAVWMEDRPGGGYRLHAALRPSPGPWSEPQPVSRRLRLHADVDLAAGRATRSFAVWERRIDGAWSIELAEGEATHWRAPMAVGAGRSPQVAVDAQGTVTVAYEADGGRLAVRTRPADGGWSDARTFAAKRVSTHDLAVNAAGDAVLAWTQVGGLQVRGVTREAGSGWNRPRTLQNDRRVRHLRTVIDSVGRSVTTWSTSDEWSPAAREYRNGIVQARTDRRGRWLGTKYVNHSVGEDGMLTDVAMNGRGDAVAVWLAGGQGGADPYTLEARRFGSDGSVGRQRVLINRWWYPARAWVGGDRVVRVLAEHGSRSAFVSMTEHRFGTDWSPWALAFTGELADLSGNRDLAVALWTDTNEGQSPLAMWSSLLEP
jgi:hypothetical protein